jgi:hypothetical protein
MDLFSPIDLLEAGHGFGAAISLTVSAWIATIQARRRMKKTLGRRPNDLELASLKTWMQVEEKEDHLKASGPIHPR